MSTQAIVDGAAPPSGPATTPLRFEVTMLPVTDVDRAKAFYTSYGTFASFADPDGNRYLLQEIGQRSAGRVW